MTSDRPLWTEQLEQVELPLRQELHAQDATATHIHFPVSALVSVLQTSPAGGEVPVALVGNDGVVGVAAFMNTGTETNRAVVLHPGLAWRLPASAVPTDGAEAASVVKAVVGHLLSLTSQISQTAYCQQHHTVERRLARWLLTALDRLPGDEVAIDLGTLAAILGVSAGAMAGAAAQLVHVGALVMPNRDALVALSCGCQTPAEVAPGAPLQRPV
jgi:CRP-like cAMP-binding protein